MLQDLKPELIPVFIDKVNHKMGNLEPGSSEYTRYLTETIDVEFNEVD